MAVVGLRVFDNSDTATRYPVKIKRTSCVPSPTAYLLQRHSTTSKKIFVIRDRKGQVVDNVQRCLLYL